MKHWLKENWFKVIIAIAVLIVAISVGYYFIVIQGQKDNIALQTECADQASKAYGDLGFPSKNDTSDSYTNHYNQKLNKCFIEISSTFKDGMIDFLSDANGLNDYADFSDSYNPTDITNPKSTVIWCTFNGKASLGCTIDDFNNFVKSYMEN